jgi:RNA polymerase sigma-70 factor (ECF subfamily)
MASRHLRLIAPERVGDVPDSLPLTFEAVFRAHAGFVGRIALRVLGRPDEVDDLVQDVFVNVLDRLGDLREPGAVRGWLAVITARMARRRLRGRRMRIWLGVGGDYDYSQLADGAASPEDRVLLAQLYAALDRLPVRHRLAWTLRHVEELELDDVASACNCSRATAKRWIAAAGAALRTEVDHE